MILKNIFFNLAFALILLSSGNLLANNSSKKFTKSNVLNIRKKIAVNKLNTDHFNFQLQNYFRLNTPQLEGSSNFQYVLGYSSKSQNHHFESSIQYFKDVKRFSISIPEAYYRTKGSHYSLTIGRKIIPWHKNEQFWQLGHLNSVRGYSLLDDKNEGLTGLYYTQKLPKHFKFNLFFSYIYLPQMNPGFDIKNGNIINRTDWGIVHPTKALLKNGKLAKIVYNINKVSKSTLILQKSLGARIGFYKKDYSISAFSIYKPESKLRIKADYAPISNTDIIVDVQPEVNHQLVSGLEVKYKFDHSLFVGGIVNVNPFASIGKDLDSLTLKQRTKDKFVSRFFSYKPKYEIERYLHASYYFKLPTMNGQLSYLHYLNNQTAENDSLSASAIKWTRAVGISLNKSILQFWNLKTSLKYDLVKYDNILNIENSFYFNDFKLVLGIQLLKAPNDRSYWSAFRSNDSIYSSFSYRL